MNPRDRDPAAPAPEPQGSTDEWTTEESIVEPLETRADARASHPAAGVTGKPAAPATPGPAPAPTHDEPSWLASSQGLVPHDRTAAPGRPGTGPGTSVDFEGTRVNPRPQAPAEDWGWQAADDYAAHDAVAVPAVATAARWDPFGPEPAPSSGGLPAFADDPYSAAPTSASAAVPARGAPVAAAPAAAAQAASDYDRYDDRPRRGVPWRRLLLSFVLGLLLTAGIAGGAIYAYEQSYADRILPNIRIGSVDVSGLTRDAARERLEQTYGGYGEGTVEVSLAGKTTEIPYSSFNRRANLEIALDAAFDVGRAAAPMDRLIGELRAVTKGIAIPPPTVLLDADALTEQVHDIARAAESDAVNAGAVITSDGFATTPSKTGQSVDEGTAAADAIALLKGIDAPKTVQVELVASPIQPAVTDTSAQAAVKQAALMQNDVVLADGSDSWTIPAATIHRWLTFTIINNRVRIAIDTKAVLAELKPLAEKIDRPARNASIKMQGTKIVFDKPSVEGRTFNPSKTTTAVVNGLRNRAIGTLATDAPIPPVLALVAPTLTTGEAKKAIPLMKPISSWTTVYQASDRNGNGANIRIPTAKISGYVVAPGDTFSFWKAVGPVTKEAGYTQGGAIIDGHTEPQGAIGGGICSCSTTLFNAALRAGFTMGDRLNHFYYINRYPLGLDATVFISASGQAQDMTWTNDTDYPVVIQGVNAKGSVKFVLYSVPNGRTVTFSAPVVKNYTKAHTETRVDKTIPRGTSKQIEYATDGQDVTTTRTVKDKSGAVIHKETYYSHYATITGIILTNP